MKTGEMERLRLRGDKAGKRVCQSFVRYYYFKFNYRHSFISSTVAAVLIVYIYYTLAYIFNSKDILRHSKDFPLQS